MNWRWDINKIPAHWCIIFILSLLFESFEEITFFRRGQIAWKEKRKTRGSRRRSISNSEWSSCSIRAPFYIVICLRCHIVCARRQMRHGASFPREYFIPHAPSTSGCDPEQLSDTCLWISLGSHLCENQLYSWTTMPLLNVSLMLILQLLKYRRWSVTL